MLAAVSGSIRFVRYGTPSFEALAAAVDDLQRDDPTAPVVIVASSARAARSSRHQLAARRREDGTSGVVNLRFFVPSDLAEELGGQACRTGGRRRATRVALEAAARAALRDRPGFLAAVAEHPSTAQELVDIYKEVRQLGGDGLRNLAGVGPRGRDLAALCSSMRERLAGSWFDDVDLVDAAVTAIGDRRDWGHVVVDLPEQERPADVRLLVALAGTCDVSVHLGLVTDVAADAPVHRLAEELQTAGFGFVGETAAAAADIDPDGPAPVGGEILEAPDAESETRAAVRLVIEHLAAGGVPERVALLFSSRDPYRRLIAGVLGEAGISWNGPSPDRAADLAAAKVLTGLLGLATGGLERSAVMAWLRSAPLFAGDGTATPVGDWERVSRLAGIVGGDAAVWRRHLDDIAEESRRALDGEGQFDGDEPTESSRTRSDRLTRLAAATISLRDFIDDLDRTCREVLALRSWEELVGWARAALRRYQGVDDDPLAATENGRRPESVVADALDQLEVLDGVDTSPDLARFSRALVAALDRPALPIGRLSSGIMVGPLESAAGVELDLAVVLGCVEGDLPRRARTSAVLSADEREKIGLDDATPVRAVERDRRRLLVAARGAGRVVLAGRDRDARDGRARIRSRFLDRDVPVRRVTSSAGAWESVAGGRIPAVGESELVGATLLARSARRGDAPSFLVEASPHLLAGSRVVAAHGARSFGRFSGRTGLGAGVGALVGDVLSPTTLEEFAVCPFRYFLGHELRCEVVDPPERRAQIDPRDRGQIAHEVLERYMRQVIERGDELDDDPVAGAESLAKIATEVCDRFERLGRTGKRVLWARTRRELLERLEAEWVRDAETRRQLGARPIAVEWVFGTTAAPAVGIAIEDTSLSFRGKIDRIDRRDDGALDVVDYKTGKASSYRGIAADPVDGGRHLQLPIYALAARAAFSRDGVDPVRASYRFIDEPGDEVAVELDAETTVRTGEVLAVLAGTVESGCFPYRPGARRQDTFEHCSWCDFNTICPAERDVLWRVARAAPVLAGYVGLVEPEVADE